MGFIDLLPINLELLSWIFAGGVAIALGGLATLAASCAVETLSSPAFRRRRRIPYLMEAHSKEKGFDLERKLAGRVNWIVVGLSISLVLMLIVSALLPESPLYAIFAATLGLGVSMLMRQNVIKGNRWKVKLEIRDFLSSLRLSLSMKPTVSLALERTAERMGEGIFAERLRHHVDTLLMTEGAMSVIERLAEEFQSKALEDLLVRLEAAKRGGLPLPKALERAAGEMEMEMKREAEFAIEDAPTKLIFPMLVTLFPPLIILLILPLVTRVLQSLGELR